MSRQLVVDCDVGVDDAWALLILIKGEELKHAGPTGDGYKIKAITTVHGNSTVDNCTKNTLRILQASNRFDIPVYEGCAKPVMHTDAENDNFSGYDGFGDMGFEEKVDLSQVKPGHAVNVMYNLVCQHPNTIDFALLGPLTNFAMCISMYGDDFLKKIGRVYIMGGNYRGKGNVTKSAEFNFLQDPEGANIVLENIKDPLVILPWETCIDSELDLTQQWRFKELASSKHKAVHLLNQIESKLNAQRNFEKWLVCDAILAAAYVFPELIVAASRLYHVTVELTGTHTRGQMVLDHTRSKESNADIIMEIDKKHYRKTLLWSVGLTDKEPSK